MLNGALIALTSFWRLTCSTSLWVPFLVGRPKSQNLENLGSRRVGFDSYWDQGYQPKTPRFWGLSRVSEIFGFFHLLRFADWHALLLYEIHFWWVEARFGKTVPVNRVKDAHDYVVLPFESQHRHTEKRTKETIKWHSHFMSLASHLPISKYDKFWIWNVFVMIL